MKKDNHHFDRRILRPGWAGELDPDQLAYIKGALKSSPALRRRWGFKTTRISEARIRKVAMEGIDPPQKSAEGHHTPSETYLKEKGKW